MALPNNPQTRKEMYLSNMAGQGTALPSEPHTREEEYLDYIAKNGGGGGTGEGDMTKAVYDDDLAVASAGGIADYVAGAITGKVDKVQGKGLSTNDYDDSAKAIVDGVTTELGNKADKVSSATNGDLASLDSNGNLTDSGKKASDFYNSSETLETELDGQDKFPFYDFSASAKRQVTFGSIKAKLKEYFDLFYTNLVSSATNGNFAGLDANGNLTDSGKKASDFATASSVTAILDGTTIDSFSDVESALADKVDVVSGKGLSTNDYDNTAKGIVDNIQSNVIANTKLIKDTVGWSGKQLIPFPYYDSSKTQNGITFTVNSDGTITVSGTATANSYFQLTNKMSYDADTDYTLNGCPSGGSLSSYLLYTGSASTGFNDIGNGVTKKGSEITDNTIYIAVYKNTVISSPITFKPMVRKADILDPTYEPYFGSTAFPRSEQAVLGAKNIWNPNDVTAWGQFEYSNGEISNTVTDTRGQLSFLIQGRKNGSFVEILVSENVATTGKKEFVLNIPDNLDINQLYIGHNGATTNLLFIYPFTKKGRYVVSFNATGIDPTTVGGIVLTEFMVSLDGGEYALPAMTNRELTEKVDNIKYTSNGTSYTVLKQYVVKPTITFSSGVGTATLYAPTGETIGSFAVACANSDKAVAHVNVSGTTATVTLTDTSYSSTAPITIIYFTYKQ